MKIAMVGPFGFHPNKTMRSRALGLARPLAAKGHEVQLFMPPWHTPDDADKSWEEDGVRLRYTPLRGGTIGVARRLLRELLAWQPDAVHCFKPKAYSGLAAWWLWQFHRRSLRLIVDTDDWEGWGGWNDLAPYSSRQKRFFAWQERWGMAHNHALTVASRALQTLAWGQGIPPERVIYVPNGAGITVGSEQFAVDGGQAERPPTVLLYSRLFEFDVGRLAAVLAKVKTAVPDLRILSVGTGLYAEDGGRLRELFAAADLLTAVTDKGWVEEADLPALLRQADIGLYFMDDTLLNRTKCPVKLADMVMIGLPVVGEAVGQVAEYVVSGQTGLLRASGDVDGLTADLSRLLQNREERKRLSANARVHYQTQFAWERQTAVLEQLYRG
jgi:glycosyltransferase involved in cell wall biosynthesis